MMRGGSTEAMAVWMEMLGKSWLPKILIQMAFICQAPLREIKNEHETELYCESQERKY